MICGTSAVRVARKNKSWCCLLEHPVLMRHKLQRLRRLGQRGMPWKDLKDEKGAERQED